MFQTVVLQNCFTLFLFKYIMQQYSIFLCMTKFCGTNIMVVTFLTVQFILNIQNANSNTILERSEIIAIIFGCKIVILQHNSVQKSKFYGHKMMVIVSVLILYLGMKKADFWHENMFYSLAKVLYHYHSHLFELQVLLVSSGIMSLWDSESLATHDWRASKWAHSKCCSQWVRLLRLWQVTLCARWWARWQASWQGGKTFLQHIFSYTK